MKLDLKIIPVSLLEQYCNQVNEELQNNFDQLTDAERDCKINCVKFQKTRNLTSL